MSRAKTSNCSHPRVVLVGLIVSDGDAPQWQIAFANYKEESLGTTLSEVVTNREFSECFNETECIEAHFPDNVDDAISKAIEIAKSQQLPLYCVTDMRPLWDCRIYEEMYLPENSPQPIAG